MKEMTNEENKLIASLGDMSNDQISDLSQEALCIKIRQLLVIIAGLDLRVAIKPVGPERVLRVDSSLPPEPTVVVEKNRRAGRAYD